MNVYNYLLENQEVVKRSILDELRQKFPQLLANDYASWDLEHGGFPKITDLTPQFDLKEYVGPSSLSIELDKKDSVAYIKWRFQCRWDHEHGFEVITHRNRIIDLSPEADIFNIN